MKSKLMKGLVIVALAGSLTACQVNKGGDYDDREYRHHKKHKKHHHHRRHRDWDDDWDD